MNAIQWLDLRIWLTARTLIESQEEVVFLVRVKASLLVQIKVIKIGKKVKIKAKSQKKIRSAKSQTKRKRERKEDSTVTVQVRIQVLTRVTLQIGLLMIKMLIMAHLKRFQTAVTTGKVAVKNCMTQTILQTIH